MSLRYTCATVGRHARTFLPPFFPTSSSLALALGPAQTTIRRRHPTTIITTTTTATQTRLSSGSSASTTLTPPWQFQDLSRSERQAFERWGPSFLEHMTPEQQDYAHKAAAARAKKAAELEGEFGSDWYAILQEATIIKDQQEHVELEHFMARNVDAGTMKELRKEFFDQRKATKAARLHEAMQTLARARGAL